MRPGLFQDQHARTQCVGIVQRPLGRGAYVDDLDQVSPRDGFAFGTVHAEPGSFVGRAGRHHDAVRLDVAEGFDGHLGPAPHVHPGVRHLAFEIVDGGRPIGQPGQPFEHAQVPAQSVAAFEQPDCVAAFGRHGRGFHTRRPAADHYDPFPLRVRHGRQRAFAPIRFATADRIQRTDQLAVLEQAGAALVTAVATDNFVLTALARFLHGERIGQQLPRQGNHVGRALAQHPLGRLQVAHLAHDEDLAAVAHDRLGAFAERRQPAFALVAFHAGQRQVQRVVAARGNVEEVEQAGRCQDLQLLLGLIGRDAALRPEKFVPGQSDADHVLRPDPHANLLGALDDEAAAFGRRAAVGVVARVVGRAHELAQPVAVGAMQFHPVDAGALGVGR